MTSWEWNVPRLRVKMTFEVGVTYMVRKVFSRAIFWEIFSKIVRLKLEQYQKGSFLTPKIPHISAPNKNFENRALLLVINFPEESLCKKSKKSLEPFSLTASNQPTNQPTNQLTIRAGAQLKLRTVTCLKALAQLQWLIWLLIVQLFEPFSTINVSIRYEIKLVSCRSRDLRLSTYAHYQNILAQEPKNKIKYALYQYTLPSDLTK